jgi:hypothetical protein
MLQQLRSTAHTRSRQLDVLLLLLQLDVPC